MDTKEAIKQKIAGHIALRSSFLTINVILIGGLATLFLNLNTIPKLILFFIGSIAEVTIFLLTVEINKDLINFYKKLEE